MNKKIILIIILFLFIPMGCFAKYTLEKSLTSSEIKSNI